MLGFEPVEDSLVLLYRGGLYTESKLFLRKGQLFVKVGAGYAKLHPSSTTSVNKLYWKEIHSNHGRHVVRGMDLAWLTGPAAVAAE